MQCLNKFPECKHICSCTKSTSRFNKSDFDVSINTWQNRHRWCVESRTGRLQNQVNLMTSIQNKTNTLVKMIDLGSKFKEKYFNKKCTGVETDKLSAEHNLIRNKNHLPDLCLEIFLIFLEINLQWEFRGVRHLYLV